MKIITLLFSLLLFFSTLMAQKMPMTFGDVPSDQLKMTVYAPDTSTNAVILYKHGSMEIIEGGTHFEALIVKTKRIKILKETGKEYGDFRIRYQHANSYEDIKSIKAVVIQPDNTVTKLDKKDIFEEKEDEYKSVIRFSLPNVQVGSIIDIKYALRTKDITHLERWYFQEEIPIQHSELVFVSPNYFSYQYFLRGYALDDNQVLKDEKYPIDVNINKGHFVLKNVPGMRAENYLSSVYNFRSHVRFQLTEITFPNHLPQKYLDSWDDFIRKYHQRNYQGSYTNRKIDFNKLWQAFEPLYDPEDNDAEKIRQAYQFVNSEIQWNGYISARCRETPNQLYKNKKASTAGLSFCLIALLREMGFTAYPMISGTRSNGLLITEIPIADQFIHTMVYVEIDDQHILIDMGDPNRPLEILNVNSLNSTGLVVMETEGKWIPINSSHSRSINLVSATLEDGHTLKGSIKSTMTGYEALEIEGQYENGVKDLFLQEYPTAVITNYDSEALTLDHPKYKGSLNFEIKLEEIDDLVFLYPVLFSDFSENPFLSDKRYNPVEFTHPFQEHFGFTLKLPDNYQVDELPPTISISSPDKLISHKFIVEEKNGTLNLVSTLSVKKSYFSAKNYAALKDFFNSFAERITTPIVLKKI